MSRGYYADIVDRNKEKIVEYIQNQLNEDMIHDQLTFQEYFDQVTGSKNN